MGRISVKNLKIVIIFSMVVISMIGVLPQKLAFFRTSERALSYLNCFSAGMFLAIGFIHMLPEAVEQYEEYVTAKHLTNAFPLPYTCMFVGYLIVLLVDRVIMHSLIGHGHHHHGTKEEVECKISKMVNEVD
jgi:zinc transporter 1/2/3